MDAPKSDKPFSDIAHCSGLSEQYLFLRDYDSKPGRVVCHFVRLETVELEDTSVIPEMMSTNNPKNDPRLKHLAHCFQAPANKLVQGFIAVLSEVMTSLSETLQLRIAVGTQAQRTKWARSLALASYFIQHGELPKPKPAPAAPPPAPPVVKEKLRRCNEDLRASGLPFPPTCERCNLGPCDHK